MAVFKPLVEEVLLAVPGGGEGAATTDSDLLGELGKWVPVEQLAARLREGSEWLRHRAEVKIPLLFVVLFLVRGVFLYFGQYLTAKVGASVIRDLRADLYESLVFQSLPFFREGYSTTSGNSRQQWTLTTLAHVLILCCAVARPPTLSCGQAAPNGG